MQFVRGEQREIRPLQMNSSYLTTFMAIIDNTIYQAVIRGFGFAMDGKASRRRG
jgi:hypothetical protein